jgi:hypothetical protein
MASRGFGGCSRSCCLCSAPAGRQQFGSGRPAGIPPLLPPGQGGQPLSRRERAWIGAPVLRTVRLIGRIRR